MRMHRLYTPGLSIFTYLLIDEKTHQCAVVDPVKTSFPHKISNEDLSITDIFETHVHADFLSGAKELKHRLKNQPVIHCSGMAGPDWVPAYADHLLTDRDEIGVGSVRIQAWHTPGHSPEHMSYIVFDDARDKTNPCVALTGDFIFVGSIGRPDLLGKEALHTLSKQLYHSIIHLLPQLPDYLEIFPGHGSGSLCGKKISGMESSTLGYERQVNPLLQARPESHWIKTLLANTPITPSYFSRMKKMNLEGPRLLADLEPPRKIQPEEFLSLNPQKTFILDARSPEEFSEGFS